MPPVNAALQRLERHFGFTASASAMTAIRAADPLHATLITAHLLSSPEQLSIRTIEIQVQRADKRNLSDARFIYAALCSEFFSHISICTS